MSQLRIVEQDGRLRLGIRLQPRASRNEIVGLYGESIKVRLTAPPVGNRANRLLIDFLSRILGISKAQITIVAGLKSHNKTVSISGCRVSEITARLIPYLV
jgi:uncharacterized protein (TIGR00251 family)